MLQVNRDFQRYAHLSFTVPTRKRIAEARKALRAAGIKGNLLTIGADPKTEKSNKAGKGYYTAILYLAPANLSGYNVCPAATAGCIAACLHTAGNPVYFKNKNRARIAKTKALFELREEFFIVLYAEIAAFEAKCERKGLAPAIRLNGTADIVWERVAPWIFEQFSGVQFYDYTKYIKRMAASWVLPVNYDLTLSRSDTNEVEVLRVLADNPKARVAVVFSPWRTSALPTVWEGYSVGDADKDDLRFLDTSRIAGLRAKGKARKDTSGFVVQVG